MRIGFNIMFFFYVAMIGIPIGLWLISVTSQMPQYHQIRVVLAALVGIGSIIYGVVGFKEVFTHGPGK